MQTTAPIPVSEQYPTQQAGVRIVLRRLTKNHMVLAGFIIVVVVCIAALLASVIAPYDPLEQDLSKRVNPPSAEHWFGTDSFGRDVFSRTLYGARVSVVTGLGVVALTSLLGIMLGLATGYIQGTFDMVLMRILDVLMSYPAILLSIGIVAILGRNSFNIAIALVLVFLPRFVRLVRGVAISLREREFVVAVVAAGATTPRVIFRHLLPNCISPILVEMTALFVNSIRAEATLSFLGLGTPPPFASWGNVLADGQSFLMQAPWISVFPGLTLAVFLLGLNLLGDGVRDLLDPRLQRR